MRKLLTLITCIFILSSSYCQTWFDLGLKGGFGTGIIMNNNIWDDPDYNHRLSPSYSFGGKIGFNFNDNHEITLDILFNKFQQDFLYNQFDSITQSDPLYKSSLSYGSISYLLMYRNNKDGRYSEIGTSIESLLNSSRTDENSQPAIDLERFNKTQLNVVAGFGAYLLGSENFGITTGIRISYGIKDIFSENGKSINLPTLKQYDTYSASHPLSILFVLEANFDFAYVAKAQCSRRKLILF